MSLDLEYSNSARIEKEQESVKRELIGKINKSDSARFPRDCQDRTHQSELLKMDVIQEYIQKVVDPARVLRA